MPQSKTDIKVRKKSQQMLAKVPWLSCEDKTVESSILFGLLFVTHIV